MLSNNFNKPFDHQPEISQRSKNFSDSLELQI